MLIHDLQSAGDHYDIVPQTVINHHTMGARINSVAWSHNSKYLMKFKLFFRYDRGKWS